MDTENHKKISSLEIKMQYTAIKSLEPMQNNPWISPSDAQVSKQIRK